MDTIRALELIRALNAPLVGCAQPQTRYLYPVPSANTLSPVQFPAPSAPQAQSVKQMARCLSVNLVHRVTDKLPSTLRSYPALLAKNAPMEVEVHLATLVNILCKAKPHAPSAPKVICAQTRTILLLHAQAAGTTTKRAKLLA